MRVNVYAEEMTDGSRSFEVAAVAAAWAESLSR